MTQDTSTVEEIIKEATNRFLGWKLPEDFAPDCGIEFQKEFNVSYNANQGLPPCKHEPVGTNLFDAQQAKAMVRYILEDVVTSYGNARYEEGVKAERERMAVWAKEHSKFADAQPVKDDSDARWEIHYAGYREAIGNLIAHLSDK